MAALVGATGWALHEINRKRPWRGWIVIGLLTAATILVQAFAIISFPDYALPVILAGLLLWLAGFALLALQKWDRTRPAAYALLVAAVAVAPMVWSFATTFNPGASMGLPNAGPQVGGQSKPIAQADLSESQEVILEYLLANTDPEGYLLATTSSQSASPYIIATGRPVLTFGGFSGRDDVITVEQLQEMVESGELRYVLGDGSLQNQKPEIAAWVQQNCSVVPLPGLQNSMPQQGPGRGQQGSGQLYDCGASFVLQEIGNGYTQ
jgi:4-amino-4-deoxy-L-arabinose transferase-like glycosyltransferase